MRRLRILGQMVLETFHGLKQSGWSSWLVISILAIALTIFGGILQLTMTLKNVVNSWGSQLQISAYLNDGVDPHRVARQISQLPDVKLVEIVTKEVAWQEMQATFKVASLNNPLPNTLHIHSANTDAVEKLAASIQKLGGVEHVRYPAKVAKNINQFRHFLEAAGVAITAALSAATLMVIGNTVQLVIQSRRKEIEILSLMGVSPWYIKGPVVLQGAAYGALSAMLAIAIIWGIHLYMDAYVTGQLAGYLPMFADNVGYGMLPTFLVILSLGIAVGAGGSYWTSGRYIRL